MNGQCGHAGCQTLCVQTVSKPGKPAKCPCVMLRRERAPKARDGSSPARIACCVSGATDVARTVDLVLENPAAIPEWLTALPARLKGNAGLIKRPPEQWGYTYARLVVDEACERGTRQETSLTRVGDHPAGFPFVSSLELTTVRTSNGSPRRSARRIRCSHGSGCRTGPF